MAYETKLGTLCKRGHDHENSGKTIRHAVHGYCLECDRFLQAGYRARDRALKAAAKAKAALRENVTKVTVATAKPTPQRAMTPAHRRALSEVIDDVARKFSSRFSVEHGDLVQEGWMYAMGAYQNYWVKCDEHSIQGLRGWVFRVIYPRLAMFSWKATVPVSFPKKALPAQIRDGVTTVSTDVLTPRTTSDLEAEFAEAEKLIAVDKAMGRVLKRYPLAAMSLRKSLPATVVARTMGRPELVGEVRRQVAEARVALKNALNRTIKEYNHD